MNRIICRPLSMSSLKRLKTVIPCEYLFYSHPFPLFYVVEKITSRQKKKFFHKHHGWENLWSVVLWLKPASQVLVVQTVAFSIPFCCPLTPPAHTERRFLYQNNTSRLKGNKLIQFRGRCEGLLCFSFDLDRWGGMEGHICGALRFLRCMYFRGVNEKWRKLETNL